MKKLKRKLLGVTFVPTFWSSRKGRNMPAHVVGTGRYCFKWDDGTESHPYWICCHKDTGELYLWSSQVKLMEKTQDLHLNLRVLNDAIARQLKIFECFLTLPNFKRNKGKSALGRFRITLNRINVKLMPASEIRTRISCNPTGDQQLKVTLSEMEFVK